MSTLIDILSEPVSKYTNHKMTTVASNVSVSDAAKVMSDSKVDSILVFENEDVIGIATIKDILSDIVAKGKDPNKVSIKEIAQKHIIKINKDSKVKDAIELMKKHDIRRLIVTNEERPIGIISRKSLVGNIGEYTADLPELESPNKIRCPYCSSEFDDKKTLSAHIDDIHIGKGLLEGNLSKAGELGSIKTPTNPRSI